MEEEEGNREVYQARTLFMVPIEARTMVPPPQELSPTMVNICRAYSGLPHDAEMLNDDEDEDADYEIDDDEDEDDDEEEDVEDESSCPRIDANMGSFSEPGRRFLSKVWKEYEPIRVDGVVVAAKCKHCARNICAERKHGTSSLRKHLRRCNERKKVLRVAGQLPAACSGDERWVGAPDQIEEWLVDFDPAMSGGRGSPAKGLGPAEEETAPHVPAPTATACAVSVRKVSDGSAAPNSGEFGVKAEAVQVDGSLPQAGELCGGEIGEKAELMGGGLDELLAPDQLLASGIGDLAVKEDASEGAVAMEMAAAPADVEMNTAVSGGKVEQESSEEESDGSEEESSKASSSSDDEEQGDKKDEESSEASSSSDEEELGAMKLGGAGEGNSLEALLEEGELMVGSDEEDEEPKGRSKSKHSAEVLPPVPKIEIQLEPHHQTLPVGTISAIMGERVIVEGSVQHSPLNEGSILWITESRMPLGIVDELFGPVKNPYYLVRYNSEEDVPAGISAGTSVSFVADFADRILNMKELYAKGYDASADNDDQEDEPEFSDDEKEAEYKRSLRQAKRQTDRQQEPKKHSGDKKRSQPKGGGFRKDMPPRNQDAPAPGQQSHPRFHSSDMAPAIPENGPHSLGPQNAPWNAPTMLPPGLMNPAMPSPVHLANQMGGCFINPAQQFLPQQPNMIWPGGLPPPANPNMGVDGAALAASIMQNLLAGANQFQQQLQNQNFGRFPNQMPMPFPPFMPQTGMPANQLPFTNQMPFGGGPPVGNTPFGASPQMPKGEGNFGQPPLCMASGNRQEQGTHPGFPADSQGFTNPVQPHGDGTEHSPPQFSSGQFNQGSSSFRGGRPQRGGRHSSGRSGGRGGRHHR